LPVLIHDLDEDDKLLIQDTLAGHLRGIEFIYKEPGVNRPLKINDDDKDNQHKTKYSNQVNKLANAVKDIVRGLKDNSTALKNVPEEAPAHSNIQNTRSTKLRRFPWIFSILIICASIIIALKFLIFNKEESIAVLPFLCDAEYEFMSLGLTDEIINNLYKIKSFDKVLPLESVLNINRLKEDHKIAKDLNVHYILSGTYKISSNLLKISAHLIDNRSNEYVWQSDFEREYTAENIIQLEAEIALSLANELNLDISDNENKNIQKIGTTNLKAFEILREARSNDLYYLTTEERFSTITDSCLRKARIAIELDPGYAEAYAYAGMYSLASSGSYGLGGKNTRDVAPDAVEYSQKALALDQNNAMAHFTLGHIYYWINWDYIMAEQEFVRADALEPNNSTVTNGYLEFLIKTGRYKDAGSLIKERDLDIRGNRISTILFNYRQIRWLQKRQEKTRPTDLILGERMVWYQKYDSALTLIRNGINQNIKIGSLPKFQALLAIALYKTNRRKEANDIIGQIKEKANRSSLGSPDYFIGLYYSGINDIDSAFFWLQHAYKNGSTEMTWLKSEPLFYNLRKDSRYIDLYNKTGFKDYDDYLKEK